MAHSPFCLRQKANERRKRTLNVHIEVSRIHLVTCLAFNTSHLCHVMAQLGGGVSFVFDSFHHNPTLTQIQIQFQHPSVLDDVIIFPTTMSRISEQNSVYTSLPYLPSMSCRALLAFSKSHSMRAFEAETKDAARRAIGYENRKCLLSERKKLFN